MAYAIAAQIFRAYDIRGIAGEDLTASDVYQIARAYATLAQSHGQNQVVIARDGRLSGPEFEQQLLQGLIDSGMQVTVLGILPTPVLYFATNFLPIPNGIMLTASHNPGNYNGLKCVLQKKALDSQMIQDLRQIILDEAFIPKSQGTVSHYDIKPDYIQYIQNTVKLPRPLKVVVDSGNGAAGEVGPAVYRALGCEVIELFCEIRGDFPNHHPDPSRLENLKDLIHAVKTHQADIGLAFDGDGDRLGVVTNSGDIIWPDRQLMLYAKYALAENPGRAVVYDVKCSKALADVVMQSQGVPVMCRTGHSHIKSKIKEVNAVLGGEMSGHLMFNDRWFGFDDAIYSGARLLEILSNTDESSQQLFAELPHLTATPEINVKVPEAEKFVIMERILAECQFADAEKITIDGLRVEFKEGWAIVRASNTSAYLTIRFEAQDEAALAMIQQRFKNALLMVKSDLELPF